MPLWEYGEDYKYNVDLPKYRVDLNELPEVRWNEIIEKEEANGIALLNEINEEFRDQLLGIPFLDTLLKKVLGKVQKYFGGDTDFHADMKAFADGWGVSVADIVTANLSYELSHFDGFGLFGCTAVCRWLPRRGWFHGRNMDWSVDSLGPYSIIIEFKGKAGTFSTLSWPGCIGVLQGVAKGRFSATINWAPSDGLGPQWPPMFLLREVFNLCGTFSEAVALIREIDMAAAAFFMLCGVRKEDAVVIEKGRNYCIERKPSSFRLVQTNHHIVRENLNRNNDFEPDEDTFESYHYAARALPHLKIVDVKDMYKILNKEPIWNRLTVQQMVMKPKTGDYDFRGIEWK